MSNYLLHSIGSPNLTRLKSKQGSRHGMTTDGLGLTI